MLDQLFPISVDNSYRGYKLALWLFGLVVFMKASQSLVSIFNPYLVVSSADGIPVGTFPPAAAQTVVDLFALLGLSQFMICLLGALVLVRYRSLVPMMFALVLLQHLGGRLILWFRPLVRTGTPPGIYVNLVLITVMIVGLALSLRRWEESDRAGKGAAGLPACIERASGVAQKPETRRAFRRDRKLFSRASTSCWVAKSFHRIGRHTV